MQNKNNHGLIKPSTKLISQFRSFWYPQEREKVDYYIQVFEDTEEVDLRDFIEVDTYRKYGEKDKEITDLLKECHIEGFMHKVNSVYHTRVSDLKLLQESDCKEYFAKKDFEGFLKYCKEKTGSYPYSFASKLFNFIDPDKYPIIDSRAVTFLSKYLDEDKISKWGDYSEYTKAYELLKSNCNIDEKMTYKDMDIYIWTYADIIQKYWEKQYGIFGFKNVSYKRH